MSAIPYVERRRQRLYLRVRVPADLRAAVGKDFFMKSLKTSCPRQARAEAARLLAEVRSMWQEMRRMAGDDTKKWPKPLLELRPNLSFDE